MVKHTNRCSGSKQAANGDALAVDYVTGIDGLRAVAVLAVMIYHLDALGILPGGFTGVDVFFVISGYVISKSLYSKPSSNFAGFIFAFYKRRMVRIFPALVVCLFAIIVASTLFIPPSWLSATNIKTSLAAFFGYSNYALIWFTDGYFSPIAEFNPALHTWSLGVEEQFYVIFPLLFYLWKNKGSRRSVGGFLSRGLLVALALVSLVFAYYETAMHANRAFYLLPSRFWELAAGAWLYRRHLKKQWVCCSKAASGVCLVSGAVLLVIGFISITQKAFPFPWAMAPVIGTMLMISGVVNRSGDVFVVHRVMQSGLATYVGRLSYSLYLWHWPIYTLFRWTVGFQEMTQMLLAVAMTFICAMASYHYVETPLRTSMYVRNQSSWKVVLAGVLVVILGYAIGTGTHNSRKSISFSVTKDAYNWYPYNHSPQKKYDVPDSLDVGGRNLFVVGDSHTDAYSTMLHEVSAQLKVNLHKYAVGGMNVYNLIAPVRESSPDHKYLDHIIATIEGKAKPNDIVFLASLRMNRFVDQWHVFNQADVVANQQSQKAIDDRRLALEQASRLIARLGKRGIRVVMDAPKPVFKAPPFRCSDWFNRNNPICSGGLTVPREFLVAHRQPVMDSIKILADRHANLYVWDPLFTLCPEDVCSAFEDNIPLFFDGDHLSGHGNRVLAPSFITVLFDIWAP